MRQILTVWALFIVIQNPRVKYTHWIRRKDATVFNPGCIFNVKVPKDHSPSESDFRTSSLFQGQSKFVTVEIHFITGTPTLAGT